MGKIRVKVIGDEQAEKEQHEKARQRAEMKKVEKQGKDEKVAITEKTTESHEKIEVKKPVETVSSITPRSKYAAKTAKAKHSKQYETVAAKVDKSKTYLLNEALTLLPQLKLAKFDESVELHINTIDKGISGSVVLPHGTGKKLRIEIVNQADDPKKVEELVKKIEAGHIDFDVLLATPDSMPKLARVARFLGPRGLMPNPKNGTITPKPEDAAKKYEGGQVNFKTEAKFPILHLVIGKISFGTDKLQDNIKTAIDAVQMKNIKNVTLKSTMSPAIKIATSSLQ